MSAFLDEMAAASRARARELLAALPLPELRRMALDTPPPPPLELDDDGFDLIAEVKLASPSEGRLAAEARTSARVREQALAYARGGAAVLSVLTEPTRFGGAIAHLAAAAGCGLPLMRKDFLVDPAQVWEARTAGCSGVLVIARIARGGLLGELCAAAAEADLFVLAEAFDGEDLEAIATLPPAGEGAPPRLVGVNCRDLRSLRVEPSRLAELAGAARALGPAVAESSLAAPDDAARIAALGYRLALVGTALMRADDPAALVRGMLAAARAEAPQ